LRQIIQIKYDIYLLALQPQVIQKISFTSISHASKTSDLILSISSASNVGSFHTACFMRESKHTSPMSWAGQEEILRCSSNRTTSVHGKECTFFARGHNFLAVTWWNQTLTTTVADRWMEYNGWQRRRATKFICQQQQSDSLAMHLESILVASR